MGAGTGAGPSTSLSLRVMTAAVAGGLISGPQAFPPPPPLPGSEAAAPMLSASGPAVIFAPGSVSHHSQPLPPPNPCSSALAQASPGGTAWFTHPGHSQEPLRNYQGDGGDALGLNFDSDISTHGKGSRIASADAGGSDGSGIPCIRHRTSAPAAPGRGASLSAASGTRVFQGSASTGRRHSAVGMSWMGSNASLLRMQDASSSDPLPQALGGQAAPPRMRAWHENLISLVASPPDPVCAVLRWLGLFRPKTLGCPPALPPAPFPRLPYFNAPSPACSCLASCLESTSSSLTPSS